MPHALQPAADALIAACARGDWAQASRQWRALPLLARHDVVADAMLCACSALAPTSPRSDRAEADHALSPLCSMLGQAGDFPGRASPEVARALAEDCCKIGLFHCLLELSGAEPLRREGAGFEQCLESWTELHFSSDARSFLTRFDAQQARAGLDALREIIAWSSERDSGSVERARRSCARAAGRFWPDARDELARKAEAILADASRSLEHRSAALRSTQALEQRSMLGSSCATPGGRQTSLDSLADHSAAPALHRKRSVRTIHAPKFSAPS